MSRTIPEINITVKDEDEAPLQGVSVKLGDEEAHTTGSAGGCKYENITEGTYTVTATLEGYDSYEEEINFTVESASLNITLTETGE